MPKTLNITNGDCAADIMRKAGVPGDILPWRDVLHDGPVPDKLDLQQLSQVRAQFIIDRGWGEAEQIRQSFIERDRTLESVDQYKKVILWFEHDLYDQLQLLQILDWLGQNKPIKTDISIICVDQYLGTLSPQEMAALFEYEKIVTEPQFDLAHIAWSAFRSDTPQKWFALLAADTSALPFLDGAITRQLEEYPACTNGLSRTAHLALDVIHQGETRPGRIFERNQASEARHFMGDSSFWIILNELLASSPPLLHLPQAKQLSLPIRPEQALTLTPAGKEVLSSRRNWLESIQLDKWIGGVHLSADNLWCWDSLKHSIVNVKSSKQISN